MLSRFAIAIATAVLLYTSFMFFPRWSRDIGGGSIIEYDVCGYYWYLPALFIYNDIKGTKPIEPDASKGYQITKDMLFKHDKSGNYLTTYTSGMAVVYLPFFVVAHIAAPHLGYPPDGYSPPYQLALQLGAIIIAVIGLFYYRKLLLRLFNDKVAAIMILLLVIGTNYLNYTAIDGALSHVWLFTIYVLLLLNTQNFYNSPSRKYAVRIGLLVGLAILIRPTEFISMLIPLLWGVESISIKSIKERLRYLAQQKRYLTITTIIVILLGSIQILYWYYVSGQPLVYSYEEKGFSWLKPHLYNYIFSARSGWLSYTPLLIFSFIGLIPFMKYGKSKIMVVVIFAISLYITSAWDIWWYGGTGGRAMIQVYPVILLPFAALIKYVIERSIKWVVLPFLLLFTYVNIWFTYNAHAQGGLYDATGMSAAYYWHVIGRFKVPEHTLIYKDTDEYFDGEPIGLKLIYFNDFEQDTNANLEHIITGQRSAYIDGNIEYGPEMKIPFNNKGNADWLRAEIDVHIHGIEWEAWKMPQFIVSFSSKEKRNFKNNMIRINRHVEPFSRQHAYFDVKIPKEEFDTVTISLWNPGSHIPIVIDNVALSTFQE